MGETTRCPIIFPFTQNNSLVWNYPLLAIMAARFPPSRFKAAETRLFSCPPFFVPYMCRQVDERHTDTALAVLRKRHFSNAARFALAVARIRSASVARCHRGTDSKNSKKWQKV